MQTTHYILKLSNGHGWHIIASKQAASWVNRLARIMELRRSELNGYPKLIFLDKDEEVGDALFTGLNMADMPGADWKLHDLKWLHFYSHNDVPDMICRFGNDDTHGLDIVRMWQALHPIYERALGDGGLPFHAGLAEWKGRGVLFAASGGTGKSTCCRRLPPPWKALCDDETLIVKDKQGKYLAHPFPTWSEYIFQRSEKTWDAEQHAPVSALFFLEQAERDEVAPIGTGKASIYITQSSMQICRRDWRYLDKKEEVRRKTMLFDNACTLAKAVPSYILRVSLTGEFWKLVEEVVASH